MLVQKHDVRPFTWNVYRKWAACQSSWMVLSDLSNVIVEYKKWPWDISPRETLHPSLPYLFFSMSIDCRKGWSIERQIKRYVKIKSNTEVNQHSFSSLVLKVKCFFGLWRNTSILLTTDCCYSLLLSLCAAYCDQLQVKSFTLIPGEAIFAIKRHLYEQMQWNSNKLTPNRRITITQKTQR